MLALTVNKNSYRHRFATVYDGMSEWDTETDICSYTRRIIRGFALWLFCVAAAGIFVGGSLGDMLAWIAAMIMTGSLIDPRVPAGIAAGLITAVGILILHSMARKAYYEWMAEHPVVKKEPEPSFLAEAYSAFKHKYCFPVTIITTKE